MIIQQEEWLPIKGYEGIYEVSNLGQVRVLDHNTVFTTRSGIVKSVPKRGRIKKQSNDSRGLYMLIGLSKAGKTTMRLVHRLVAESFVANPLNLPEVNHIDENKVNNRSDNLEWCTHTYNNNFGKKNGARIGIKNPMSKFPVEIIDKIRTEYIHRDKEFGLTGLSKKYGVSISHICSIICGRRRSKA